MNKRVEKIVEQIRHQYENIDTILLFGSATEDSWTAASDIDIFLIDDSLSDSREDLEIEDISVEIQKDNFENLAEDIKNEKGSLLNRNLSTMISTSIVIKNDSSEKLIELKNIAKEVLDSKTTYTDEDIKMWLYSIDDYIDKAEKDLTKNDAVAFYLDANYALQNTLELILAKNNTFLPQPKNLKNLLEKIAPEFLEIFEEFSLAATLPLKFSTLKSLRDLIMKDENGRN